MGFFWKLLSELLQIAPISCGQMDGQYNVKGYLYRNSEVGHAHITKVPPVSTKVVRRVETASYVAHAVRCCDCVEKRASCTPLRRSPLKSRFWLQWDPDLRKL